MINKKHLFTEVLEIECRIKYYFYIINKKSFAGGMNFEEIHNHWIVCFVISGMCYTTRNTT